MGWENGQSRRPPRQPGLKTSCVFLLSEAKTELPTGPRLLIRSKAAPCARRGLWGLRLLLQPPARLPRSRALSPLLPAPASTLPALNPQTILHIFKSPLLSPVLRPPPSLPSPPKKKREKEITKACHLSPSPHPIYQAAEPVASNEVRARTAALMGRRV